MLNAGLPTTIISKDVHCLSFIPRSQESLLNEFVHNVDMLNTYNLDISSAIFQQS